MSEVIMETSFGEYSLSIHGITHNERGQLLPAPARMEDGSSLLV